MLCDSLCSEPILGYPNFNKTFQLSTAALVHAVGSILTQEEEGLDMPVAYFSKAINSCQESYPKEEQKCLGFVQSIKHFRPYLYL